MLSGTSAVEASTRGALTSYHLRHDRPQLKKKASKALNCLYAALQCKALRAAACPLPAAEQARVHTPPACVCRPTTTHVAKNERSIGYQSITCHTRPPTPATSIRSSLLVPRSCAPSPWAVHVSLRAPGELGTHTRSAPRVPSSLRSSGCAIRLVLVPLMRLCPMASASSSSARLFDQLDGLRVENLDNMPAVLGLSCDNRLARSEWCSDAAWSCDTVLGSMNAWGKMPHLPLAFVPDQHQWSGCDPS